MRGRIVKLFISLFALIFTIASFSLVYAWYTNMDYVASIDAEAEGLSFHYTINSNEVKNEDKFDITSLTFFDPQNESELKHFSSMSYRLTLKMSNNDNQDKRVKLEYEAKKEKIMDGDITKSSAYPAAIISPTATVDTSSALCINDLIVEDPLTTDSSFHTELSLEIPGKSEMDIYFIVFGIQDIPTATNEFLFDIAGSPVGYKFNIIITAENISSGFDVEEGGK